MFRKQYTLNYIRQHLAYQAVAAAHSPLSRAKRSMRFKRALFLLFFGFVCFVSYILIRFVSFLPNNSGIKVLDHGLPVLVSIFNPEPSSIKVLRLSDGLVQDFPGDWRVNYVSPSELVIFGSTHENPALQKLFVLNGLSIKSVPIHNLSGPVTNVSINPANTYALITGVENKKSDFNFYTCVQDIVNISEPCIDIRSLFLQISSSTPATIGTFWNSAKQRELYITDKSNVFLSYDMWDGVVSTTAESVIDNALERARMHLEKASNRVYFFHNIVLVRSDIWKIPRIFILPFNANPTRVSDSQIVYMRGTHLYMLDFIRKQVRDFDDVGEVSKIISWYK